MADHRIQRYVRRLRFFRAFFPFPQSVLLALLSFEISTALNLVSTVESSPFDSEVAVPCRDIAFSRPLPFILLLLLLLLLLLCGADLGPHMLCARRPVAPGMTQAKFQCEGGRKQKTMQW